MKNEEIANLFGVKYVEPNITEVFTPRPNDLYYYKVYAGKHEIEIEQGDCLFYLDKDMKNAILERGPETVKSRYFATLIRGYMPCRKTSSIQTSTCLPYVNGCSTKQIFPPRACRRSHFADA